MDRSQNGRGIYHKLIISLYTIIGLASPAFAEAPSNTNIAGPSASATGNVTNQAVQVLQGPFAMNTYGGGVSCQGPTLNLQTFGYNSLSNNNDPTTYQQNSLNAGLSAGFSVPLDGSFQELCKARVRTEIARQQAEADKARLDFETSLNAKGLDSHLAHQFTSGDKFFGHIAEDISSGFFTNEGNVIRLFSLLCRNRYYTFPE